MLGVILAGGKGTRLRDLVKVTNKHLLPIYSYPMITYSIKKLVGVGVTRIVIVTGTEHMGDFISYLGSGKDFSCKLVYVVQDEAGGIAQAIRLVKDLTKIDEEILVLLGDGIFKDSLHDFVKNYHFYRAQVCLKEVTDPQRYGVATLEDNKIVKLVEKPENPESNLAVAGIYQFPPNIFHIIDSCCTMSDRGELEIVDALNHYMKTNTLNYTKLKGYWTDAGTMESYQEANKLVSEDFPDF